jgi:CoA:oxalate CoA-transferase
MKALDNIRVLDLSRFQSGPVCGMLLGDMGAEVIRIEETTGGADRTWGFLGSDGETLAYKIVGRNRKGITLDLHTAQGKRILRELVRWSDVVLHNYTPNTPLADVLSYRRLKKINHGIIVAAISGFGQNGPDAGLVSFDHIAQARSGSMLLAGFPGDPPIKTPVAYNDICSGFASAMGILLALYHRQKAGVGQSVDVSLFDMAFFSAQCMGTLILYELYGQVRSQVGNRGFHSYMGCFKAKDDEWVVISGITNAIWKRLARAIGREDMVDDPRFGINDMVRFDNSKLIDEVLENWVSVRTSNEVVRILEAGRIPCSVVNTVEKLVHDRQVKAREMIVYSDYPGLGRIPLPGVPIKLSLTPGSISMPAPRLGEHNEEVYCGLLGFSRRKFEQLKSRGII